MGGEVAKCVAMNPKNGMKRRLNEKRAKALRRIEAMNYVVFKKARKIKKGVRGG